MSSSDITSRFLDDSENGIDIRFPEITSSSRMTVVSWAIVTPERIDQLIIRKVPRINLLLNIVFFDSVLYFPKLPYSHPFPQASL
jgi:hypothetical protein